MALISIICMFNEKDAVSVPVAASFNLERRNMKINHYVYMKIFVLTIVYANKKQDD